MNSRQRRRLEAMQHNQAREKEIRETQARAMFNWLYRLSIPDWKWRERRASRRMAHNMAVLAALVHPDMHGNFSNRRYK